MGYFYFIILFYLFIFFFSSRADCYRQDLANELQKYTNTICRIKRVVHVLSSES